MLQTNYNTATSTVHYYASVTLSEIKGFVADCGYRCSGECMPEHVVKVHEMGHGGGMSMKAMMLDMRNRFLIPFMLAIPVFLYSPLFTQVFKVQLPLPFGLSNEVLSFLLATPAVLYGGWVFYVGAWHGLKNRTLNMAVLVSLSVLAGYLFSVAATFLFEGQVFYEAAAMLLAFVLFRSLDGDACPLQRLRGDPGFDKPRPTEGYCLSRRAARRKTHLRARSERHRANPSRRQDSGGWPHHRGSAALKKNKPAVNCCAQYNAPFAKPYWRCLRKNTTGSIFRFGLRGQCQAFRRVNPLQYPRMGMRIHFQEPWSRRDTKISKGSSSSSQGRCSA